MQMGVAPPQPALFAAEQTTHWPAPPLPPVLQMGVAPEQPALFARQALQVFVPVSHFGVEPPQLASLRHWTHWPPGTVETSQTAVEPEQPWLVPATQVTHAPAPPAAPVLQTGVPPEQPALLARQVLQLFVVGLQYGVPPEHAELSVHSTHWPPATDRSHTPVGCAQWLLVTQVAHASAWTSQNGAPPEQPELSARQVRQLFVSVLHSGRVPPHCVLLTHSTQTGTETSHTGVPPEQPALSARHAWQVYVLRLHCVAEADEQ
jgi:hypothetical protein